MVVAPSESELIPAKNVRSYISTEHLTLGFLSKEGFVAFISEGLGTRYESPFQWCPGLSLVISNQRASRRIAGTANTSTPSRVPEAAIAPR